MIYPVGAKPSELHLYSSGSHWVSPFRANFVEAILIVPLLVAWLVTMFLSFQEWRTGKTIYRPEDPPFSLPTQPIHQHDDEDNDPYTRNRRQTTEEDDEYDHHRSPFNDNNRYADHDNNNPAGRPSMDAYGAFSDPNPSGYGRTAGYDQPPVSRTMQYADPYAQVSANIHHGSSTPPMPQPGQYAGYQR
jgi:hypothetical protein